MNDYWKLINNDSEITVTYSDFKDLEEICKALIDSGKSTDYLIEYFIDGKLDETIDIDVYFN